MVYFQVQDKITQVQSEKSVIQSGSLDCYLIAVQFLSIDRKSHISKRKKPITCPF